MAAENRLWGQKRIRAELARLGFQVSARTVAKYMRGCRRRGPTGTWREFLTRHASTHSGSARRGAWWPLHDERGELLFPELMAELDAIKSRTRSGLTIRRDRKDRKAGVPLRWITAKGGLDYLRATVKAYIPQVRRTIWNEFSIQFYD